MSLALLVGAGLTGASRSQPAAAAPQPSLSNVAFPRCSQPDTVAWRMRGQVLDGYTQAPFPAASVWLKRLGIGTMSDEQGYFVLELTADQLAEYPSDSLLVQAAAFRPQLQPLTFLTLPSDSVFSVVLTRDSALQTKAPLPYKPVRRHEARTGRPSVVRRVLGNK